MFCSYSHKDEDLRAELDTHLKLLQRQSVINLWHDRRIPPGDEWERQIHEELDRADVILMLVSSDFLASHYCYDVEVERAMARHDAGEARVIPVMVRDVSWHSAPFAKCQPLPKEGKPVTSWGPDVHGRDSGLAERRRRHRAGGEGTRAGEVASVSQRSPEADPPPGWLVCGWRADGFPP